MRAIKYRAWHDGEMYSVDDMRFNDTSVSYAHLIQPSGRILYHMPDMSKIELMQSTGLYDCSGKEVYEGDIVEDVLRQPYLPEHKRRWLVYWREQFAGFYLKNMEDIDKPASKQWIDLLYGGNVGHFAIIGNIYEGEYACSHQT